MSIKTTIRLITTSLIFYSLITTSSNLTNSSCNFEFGSIVLLTGSRPRLTVAAGFNMALEDYNNGNLAEIINISHNECIITANMNDMESDIKIGIVRAFELGQLFGSTSSNFNIPIIIGPPTSSYSLTLNPLITAFNLIQFSSTATSTFLSSYSSFFRSVPSDDLQANALIKICKYFKWNNIGIMYVNSNYGSSLQQALTSYAKNNNISSTTFSYIDGDNLTISDAVESMKQSGIYINILITYKSDLQYITSQIIKHSMSGYPYYFLGTDSWLNFGDEYDDDDEIYLNILDVFGGVIGTCPWSPSLNDSFIEKYPYPINESIVMFTDFNQRWNEYYKENRNDIIYGYSSPGFFTGYAYDNVLTVIKSIEKYIHLYGLNDINNDTDITSRFNNILHSIWFIGLTGNVTYDNNGDRANGLFSFCNIDPLTGNAINIGYVIDDNNDNDIDIDETLIKWPSDYIKMAIIPPRFEYIKYEGIPKWLLICVWTICIISILFAIICIFCLFIYRERPIIKSSQWKLSCIMCIGVIIAYITIMVFGIDEHNFNLSENGKNIYCNIRILLFNISFGLSFGPLFCKVYRINTIFNVGKKLQKINLTDTKMTIYNLIFVAIDFILCLILISSASSNRIYKESEAYDIEKEFYGNCQAQYWYIYGLILILPKLILCCYAIIISISVYNTVSMMKFNEGLQVLMAVVISVILITIVVIILSVMDINNQQSATFYYGFLSLILIIVCNFCIFMMLLPRLVAIWRGYEEEYIKKNEKIENRVNKYLQKLKTFKRVRKNTNSTNPSLVDLSSTEKLTHIHNKAKSIDAPSPISNDEIVVSPSFESRPDNV